MVVLFIFFFFNDPATTEIYTLSLHDALPISEAVAVVLLAERLGQHRDLGPHRVGDLDAHVAQPAEADDRDLRSRADRSEEHTSELQSRQYLVCRLLLEKKKHQELYTHRALHR